MAVLEQAISLLEEYVSSKATFEDVPLACACGRILQREVLAPFPVPSFPKSAMDGYAVFSSDTEGASAASRVTLHISGEILAGDKATCIANKGDVCRIMTGAIVPDGYDAVIRQEDVECEGSHIFVSSPIARFRNYCCVGEDIAVGEEVLPAGTRLTPVDIGILASMGIGSVRVIEPLRVPILCTGAELCEAGSGEIPPEGKIYNSLGPMFASYIQEMGGIATYAYCGDDVGTAKAFFAKEWCCADIFISTGGVSVGKMDIIPQIMEEIGAEILFDQIDIQPGTPTKAYDYRGKLVLCLSGNPYAALTHFQLLFYTAAAKKMGCDFFSPKRKQAIMAQVYENHAGRRRLVRAADRDGLVYLPSSKHASSILSNLNVCNCLVDVAPRAFLSVGDEVTIFLLRGSEL